MTKYVTTIPQPPQLARDLNWIYKFLPNAVVTLGHGDLTVEMETDDPIGLGRLMSSFEAQLNMKPAIDIPVRRKVPNPDVVAEAESPAGDRLVNILYLVREAKKALLSGMLGAVEQDLDQLAMLFGGAE